MAKEKVLVDANVFIALNYPKDTNHKRAKVIFQHFTNKILITNNYLVSEMLTVLLYRTKNLNQVASLAKGFYRTSRSIQVIQLNLPLQRKTLVVFCQQNKHHLSFADCSLIAQARSQKIKTILSFDKDLQREFSKEFTFLPKKLS